MVPINIFLICLCPYFELFLYKYEFFIVSTNVKQYEFRIYETRLSMQKKLKESNDRKENLLNLISTQ